MTVTVPIVAADGAKSTVVLPDPVVGAHPLGPTGGFSKLAFEDNFNGSSLDTTKWNSSWFNGSTMNNVTTSPSNVSVSGGLLTVQLSSSTVGALISTNPHDGISGRTGPGFQFTTGVVEGRVYFPGDGTHLYNWGAFWTDGQQWPQNGEIDIAEVLSPGVMMGHYQHGLSGVDTPVTLYNGGYLPGWHIYTAQRTAGQAQIWVDGVLMSTWATDDGESPHYIIVNIGVSTAGTPTLTGSAGAMQVDYVRAWT